jgi:hypothetical protein
MAEFTVNDLEHKDNFLDDTRSIALHLFIVSEYFQRVALKYAYKQPINEYG